MITNKSIKISVIIASYNGEKFLPRCLNSLFSERNSGFEVILVDDCSTDKSLELVRNNYQREKRLRLIALKKNMGAARARNIGVQKSQGEILFFLDSDTEIEKDWLKKTTSFFQKNPQVDVVQAKLLKMGTNQFDYAGDYIGPFGFLIERARSAKDEGQFDQVTPIFALKSAAMLAKKEMFKEIGGFDEDFRFIIEDTDFSWRARIFGYGVFFAPFIKVWHAYGTKEKNLRAHTLNQIAFLGSRNTITGLIKNLGLKKLSCVLPMNICCWIILAGIFLFTLRFKRGWSILRGILEALISLPKTLEKRKVVQSNRRVSDQEIFKLVGAKRDLLYYLGKGLAYLSGRPF